MIEIYECKVIKKGPLLASISIKIGKWGNFRIKRIKIFENNQGRWITLPSEEYEKEGKKKWFALNDFEDQAMNDAFKNKILKAFDQELEKLASEQPENSKISESENHVPF